MDEKLKKKDHDIKKSVYENPFCFQLWIDAFGYHYLDMCRYLPENRK